MTEQEFEKYMNDRLDGYLPSQMFISKCQQTDHTNTIGEPFGGEDWDFYVEWSNTTNGNKTGLEFSFSDVGELSLVGWDGGRENAEPEDIVRWMLADIFLTLPEQ